MSMMFWHCPICYDGKDLCKCSESDYDKFYKELEKNKKESLENERKRFHDLLDRSFDKYHKTLGAVSFPEYLAQEILKELKRGEWEAIKRRFDDWFKC